MRRSTVTATLVALLALGGVSPAEATTAPAPPLTKADRERSKSRLPVDATYGRLTALPSSYTCDHSGRTILLFDVDNRGAGPVSLSFYVDGKHTATRAVPVTRHSPPGRVFTYAWSAFDYDKPYPHHASITVLEVRRGNQVLARGYGENYCVSGGLYPDPLDVYWNPELERRYLLGYDMKKIVT